MHVASIELDKAQYSPGDDVHVSVLLSAQQAEAGHAAPYQAIGLHDACCASRGSNADPLCGPAACSVPSLSPQLPSGTVMLVARDVIDPVYVAEASIAPAHAAGKEPVVFTIPASALSGYLGWENRAMKAKGFGIDVALRVGGRVISTATCGFDVAEHWSFTPRYGFVCEFEPCDTEDSLLDRWRAMRRFHLNVVQFYDWMYRHHELIPPDTVFTDTMGRVIDINCVRKQVQIARAFRMRPIAYGTAYAAEKDFAHSHAEWLAYTRDGCMHNLGGLFFLMDISRGSAWNDHILREFRRAMDDIGFSGIHVDQYGFPRVYYKASGEPMRTAAEFAEFIRLCRARLGPEADLIFNCVNNWPVWEMAMTPQNVVYIEVWPPHDTYRDLRDLVLGARCASGFRKQVILAAYLAAFRPQSNVRPENDEAAEAAMRLASAAIMASGGFYLVLGEGTSVLTEGYYPNFRRLRAEFASVIQRYWDFAVRYGEFLFDLDARDVSQVASAASDGDLTIEGHPFGPSGNPGTLWTFVREGAGYKVLHLVNLLGVEDPSWNAPKNSLPRAVESVKVRWLIDEDIRDILFASPDASGISCTPLSYTVTQGPRGRVVEFNLPRVEYWSTALVRLAAR